ncbi:hypothetical protein TRFO_04742 [Tritrichomonas foetus]|uniref:Uncharacterized protein n=1 Tax=Tritrichomonas foetus TaxID=1144522 RepID=A0A1J4KFX7_9EUKA|nr:hypothetical protein TRFO_04742 [Tritrichomonas foetus]|eukprot:OHT08684.1 hypothetical protein TRFO_04742 [Tritrichomonas foetus]
MNSKYFNAYLVMLHQINASFKFEKLLFCSHKMDHEKEKFLQLFNETRQELSLIEKNVGQLVNLFGDQNTKKHECDSLRFENEILQRDLESEERWMHRIAEEALESEEKCLLVTIRCIWLLASKEPNTSEILNNGSVLNILAETLCMKSRIEFSSSSKNPGDEHPSRLKMQFGQNDDTESAIFGVFANICQSKEATQTFACRFPDALFGVVESAKNTLTRSLAYVTRAQMALVFLHNLSSFGSFFTFLAEQNIPEVVAQSAIECVTASKINGRLGSQSVKSSLYQKSENVDEEKHAWESAAEVAIRVLAGMAAQHGDRLLAFIQYDTVIELYRVLTSVETPKTPHTLSLITYIGQKANLTFPSLHCHAPPGSQ